MNAKNVVVEYTYDAWGKSFTPTGSMASTLGAANPFRYRGYFYDVETGLYYLLSRYYNPDMGRFINADAVDYINGSSLFVYCGNNPVINIDPTGQTDRKFELTFLVNNLSGSYTYHPYQTIYNYLGQAVSYRPAWYGIKLGKLYQGVDPGSYTIPYFCEWVGATCKIVQDLHFRKNGAFSTVTDFGIISAVTLTVDGLTKKINDSRIRVAINLACGLAAALTLNVLIPNGDYTLKRYEVSFPGTIRSKEQFEVYVIEINTFAVYDSKGKLVTKSATKLLFGAFDVNNYQYMH